MSISSDYEYRRDNHPSQSREGQKLFVKKIPMDMEEDEICDIFGRYGTLTRASILPTKPEFDYKAAIVIFDSPQEAELALNSISGAPPHNLHVSFAKSHREPRTDSSNISNLRYGNRPGRTTQEILEVTSPKNNSNQPPNRQSFQNMPLPTKGNPACHFYPCPNDALFKCSACGADYCREFCRNLDWKRHQEEDCMPKPPLVPRTALITDRGERSVRKEMSAQQQSVNGESNNLLRNEESLRLPRAPFSQKNLQQLNEHRLTNGDATPSSPCRDVNIRARSKSRTRADYPTSDSRVDIKGKGESGTHPRETVNGLRGRGGFHRQDARNGIMSNNAENATNNFPQGNLDEKPVSSQTEKKEVESKMRLEEQALKRADNSKGSNDSPRNTVRVSTPLIRKTEVVPSTCPVKQEDQIKTIPPCDFTLSPRTEVEVLFVRNPHFITIRPVSKNDDYKRVSSHLQKVGNRKKLEGECKVGANYALCYENVWYRCQVIRIVESEPDFIVALLVDIGKSLKKDRYDLYILDDEILGVPALSMPVKLDKTSEPSSGGWDKEVVEILRQLTEPSPDLQLFVTETGKDTSGRPIVKMIDNEGGDIVDYLSQSLRESRKEESTALTEVQGTRPRSYFLPSLPEKKGGKFFFEQAEFVKLPIGEEINVLVVHIENPAEFYVIPQDDLLGRELEENEAKINDFCINNEGTAHDPEVAEIVLAKFEGLWYRALTIAEAAPKTSSYNLQFLDYGNYAVTSSKDIRRMEDQFMYLPFVACFLTLNEFEGRDPTAQETMEFKKRLQLNSPVKVKVLEFECARYTVDIPSLGF